MFKEILRNKEESIPVALHKVSSLGGGELIKKNFKIFF